MISIPHAFAKHFKVHIVGLTMPRSNLVIWANETSEEYDARIAKIKAAKFSVQKRADNSGKDKSAVLQRQEKHDYR